MHFKIDWVSLIVGLGNLPFLLCFTLYLRANSKYKPQVAYIWRGNLTEGFLHYEFGGLIFGGTYTWRGLFSEFYSIFLVAGQFISQASFKRRKAFVLVTW